MRLALVVDPGIAMPCLGADITLLVCWGANRAERQAAARAKAAGIAVRLLYPAGKFSLIDSYEQDLLLMVELCDQVMALWDGFDPGIPYLVELCARYQKPLTLLWQTPGGVVELHSRQP